jgi:hypothetical protein
MTNFILSQPSAGWYPSGRFDRGTAMLKANATPTLENVKAVLMEISQYGMVKGNEVGTLYSSIWDVTAGEIQLYYKRDFAHPAGFQLSTELAKGAHTLYLKELFPNPQPFETTYRGDNGPVKPKPVSELSGPGESHPEALPELYVSVSTHTAPMVINRLRWCSQSASR